MTLLSAGAALEGPLDGTAGAALTTGGNAMPVGLLPALLPASEAADAPAAGALLTLLELPVRSRPPFACGRLGLQPHITPCPS
jgi:hypothetical protein